MLVIAARKVLNYQKHSLDSLPQWVPQAEQLVPNI